MPAVVEACVIKEKKKKDSFNAALAFFGEAFKGTSNRVLGYKKTFSRDPRVSNVGIGRDFGGKIHSPRLRPTRFKGLYQPYNRRVTVQVLKCCSLKS